MTMRTAALAILRKFLFGMKVNHNAKYVRKSSLEIERCYDMPAKRKLPADFE